MPKINVSSLPDIVSPVTGPLDFEVPGQGRFAFYLRQPDFPATLAVGDLVNTMETRLLKTQPARYPCETFILVSQALCRSVAILLSMLCDERGKPLQGDDAYSEEDLFKLSKLAPQVFRPLTEKAVDLFNSAEEQMGNGSGDPAALSSEGPSTTAPSTIPKASASSSGASGASTSGSPAGTA